MKLFYHPGIAGELDGATDYYESKQVGLGLRFRLAFDYAISRILETPLGHRIIAKGTRRCTLRRFPYAIYYRVEPDGVYIIVLRHHRQHPAYGMER